MNEDNVCSLEIRLLNGDKVLVESVDLGTATVGRVFDEVSKLEDPESEWKLMAVVEGRLVPLRGTEKKRKLSDLKFQAKVQYRIEVCLAWSELKKVLR